MSAPRAPKWRTLSFADVGAFLVRSSRKPWLVAKQRFPGFEPQQRPLESAYVLRA